MLSMNKPIQPEQLAKPARPAGRPRAADLEARNEHLIHTAGCLFVKLGYGKVSLELIAREAHVAVRTIYVKFGGKAGLFKAVLEANRDKFLTPQQLELDPRPFREAIREFSEHFLEMIVAPDAVEVQRMVIAEARTDPEVASSFYEAGPRLSREMLVRYFARPDIRAQLRDDLALDLLPSYLLNCVVGDGFARFLFDTQDPANDAIARRLPERLELFYASVLKQP